MREVKEIFEKIKDVISLECGDEKIFNRDVAIALNISLNNICLRSSRNSMPFEEILDFCKERDINPLEFFYEK